MPKSVIKRFLVYLKPYWSGLVGAIVAAFLSTTLTLLIPVVVGRGIDLLLGKGRVDFGRLGYLLLLLLGIIGMMTLMQWCLTYLTNKITYNTIKDLRIEAFEKLNRVPISYIDRHAHGDVISRLVNDVEQVAEGLLQAITQLFTGVVMIVGTLLFMLSIHVQIALVVVILTPLSLGVATLIGKKTHHMFKKQSQVQGELTGLIEELVGNQKIVSTFFYEERAQERFEAVNETLYEVGMKAQFYAALSNPCTRFVNGLVYAGVGITGAIAAIYGVLSIGQISCFLSYANQYTKPFNEITGVIAQLQSALASLGRIFELLDECEEREEGFRVLSEATGKMALKNVSFSYRTDQTLIEGLNLEVRPGDKVAIVGPTGCGKTTLINLLMRFYDVTKGEITFEDCDIKDYTRKSLRSEIGMVLQETWLYSGTIAENISYGKRSATEDEIIKAAKRAHAHSFIKRLPKGYQTIIGEDGGNLSVGEKQLLCIARIMLLDRRILILDEATSNIDTMTEIRIQKAFARLMEGRTSFIIAHRLQTIQEADVILVMKDGNIIEQGTHEELLIQKGFYYNLYYSQFDIA